MNSLALFGLVSVAVGGIAWVFVYPFLSGERKAEQRKEFVAKSTPSNRAAAVTRNNQKSRREQVEGSLADREARKAKSVPLSLALSPAGLNWSKPQFIIFCVGLGISAFLIFFVMGAGPITALGAGFGAGCGLPLWVLHFLTKRRQA